MRKLLTILLLVSATILRAQLPAYKIKNVGKSDTAICTGSADSFTFSYQVSYPFFFDENKKGALADSLNHYVRIAAGNYFMDSNYMQNLNFLLKKEMDSVYEVWKRDLQVKFCYNLENRENLSVIFSNKKFISLSNIWFAYDGGAHGVGGQDLMLVDTRSGRRIHSWRQLFADTAEALRVARDIFYTEKKKENCETTEWFWGGDFFLTDNFAVLKTGLVFYYQAYEIAPYAYGPTSLFIPWDKLKKAKPLKQVYPLK